MLKKDEPKFPTQSRQQSHRIKKSNEINKTRTVDHTSTHWNRTSKRQTNEPEIEEDDANKYEMRLYDRENHEAWQHDT